jgi:hypothetical protein
LSTRWTINSIITADVKFQCTWKLSVAVEEGEKKWKLPETRRLRRPPVAPQSQVKYG